MRRLGDRLTLVPAGSSCECGPPSDLARAPSLGPMAADHCAHGVGKKSHQRWCSLAPDGMIRVRVHACVTDAGHGVGVGVCERFDAALVWVGCGVALAGSSDGEGAEQEADEQQQQQRLRSSRASEYFRCCVGAERWKCVDGCVCGSRLNGSGQIQRKPCASKTNIRARRHTGRQTGEATRKNTAQCVL